MKIDPNVTAFFIGNRVIFDNKVSLLSKCVMKTINDLFDGDFRNFIVGADIGFDRGVFFGIWKIKKDNPEIKIILTIPTKTFYKNFDNKQQLIYDFMIKNADHIVYFDDEENSKKKRIIFSVENSSTLITYINNETNALYAVDYAKRRNKNIIFLNP